MLSYPDMSIRITNNNVNVFNTSASVHVKLKIRHNRISNVREAMVIVRTHNQIPAQYRMLAAFHVVNTQNFEVLPIPTVGVAILRPAGPDNGYYVYRGRCPMSVPITTINQIARISLSLLLMAQDAEGFDVTAQRRSNVAVTPAFHLPQSAHIIH
jgi:hypothetical protein